ncbi:MAG: PAS domain S-box protein [Lentisphaerae bacterium]|nr:PAS domain S-box protein [Lentisphaerota bacterium]
MQKRPSRPRPEEDLRRRAEDRLRHGRRRVGAGGPESATDIRRTLHELHVHQIELELQNEALLIARNEAESVLEKYTDLYDFAPVGYFSLDERGRILEANLTGASMLGVNRSRLVGQRLTSFVAQAERTIFTAFLERLFSRAGGQLCEVTLEKTGGASFCAHLNGLSADSASAGCRVAVSDITALKEVEQAKYRLEAMAGANEDLRLEIVRRQIVEEALKGSEHQQRELLAQSHILQGQLRRLTHQVMQAQEEERKRISRELHDEITQTLVGINLHLESLAREPAVDSRKLKARIVQTQRAVEKAVNIVHRFARDLRPAMLDDLGLILALHAHVKSFSKKTGIRVGLTAFPGVENVNGPRRTALYRVALEALANVARHAQATRAEVSFRRVPGGLLMQITDNGRAFDVEGVLHANEGKRLGLIGMRERMEMVGGKFGIVSVPGTGTTVSAQICLRTSAKERK